jgi:hypothetical protein
MTCLGLRRSSIPVQVRDAPDLERPEPPRNAGVGHPVARSATRAGPTRWPAAWRMTPSGPGSKSGVRLERTATPAAGQAGVDHPCEQRRRGVRRLLESAYGDSATACVVCRPIDHVRKRERTLGVRSAHTSPRSTSSAVPDSGIRIAGRSWAAVSKSCPGVSHRQHVQAAQAGVSAGQSRFLKGTPDALDPRSHRSPISPARRLSRGAGGAARH